MPWSYAQSTGEMLQDGAVIGTGYSGNGAGLNNPDAQDQHDVGPVPQGSYTIGPAVSPPDHLGPLALPLIPDPGNTMFGRNAFFIHGDNAAQNHTASDGCIILSPAIRQRVVASNDTSLVVVSGAADGGNA